MPPPSAGREPGGTFTFTVRVRNDSPAETVTISSLRDDVYGNIETRPGSTCGTLIGTMLAPGAISAPCTFTGLFNGPAGASQTDIVTAEAVDDDGETDTDTDDATVSITNLRPTVLIDKRATPPTLPEPGGDFTFNVVVTNTSNEPVTITSLTDSVFGSLATRGTCTTAIGTLLAAADPVSDADTFRCSFVAPFTGDAGDSEIDIATVVVTDDDGSTATDSDDAVVALTDVLPTIVVDKTATPATRLEPGGTFTFNVVVTNTSNEPVTITFLGDDVYGDITAIPGSSCSTALGTVLAAANASDTDTFRCSFDGQFTGGPGAQQRDVVTAIAVDGDGSTATDDDDAFVAITNVVPTIVVDKTAAPATLPEPGGTFTFNVVVTNVSLDPVTITSLTDDIYGNIANKGTCTGAIGTILPGGGSFSCSFTGPFAGSAGDTQTDVVTAIAVDASGDTATDDDDALVGITDVPPTVLLDKTALPLMLPEPGGTFTFQAVVTNTSVEQVTIESLMDNVYGNLATQGTCVTAIGTVLAADPDGPGPVLGGRYICSFEGPFNGEAFAVQTDIITVNVRDDDGTPATDTDDAEVTLTDVPPTVLVDKTATPLSLPEPGGTFTFNVKVTNTSAELVTITELTDDVYGDLELLGTCTTAFGTELDPDPDGSGPLLGESYTCSFPGPFTGNAGDAQTDVITVMVVDNDGTPATDDDDAEVTLTDVPPTVLVDKTAAPLSLPEPGGTFTFNVKVTNTSAESVKITELIDDVYGNLALLGTCTTAIGTELDPDPDGTGPLLGESYTCSFEGPFTGNAGDAQTDVITVTVEDDDGTEATDDDDAEVTLTDVPPTVLVDKTATPLTLPEPGGTFTFNVKVTNTSAELVTITDLTDDVYGDISTEGTCTTAIDTELAPDPDGTGPLLGESYTCSFEGPFTGNAGDAQTDVVTVTVEDNDGTEATDDDDAEVTLTDVPPTVLVDKTATPLTLTDPGGTFTFTVKVTNTSAEKVTITELTDDIYGNISTKGTCTNAVGTVLDADPDGTGPKTGGTYTCSFPGLFNGTSGASQTDVITVTVKDDDGTPGRDTDDAVVTITSKPPVVVNQQKEKPPAVVSKGPLPRTGAEAARLLALAGALILFGTLLVSSSTRAFFGLSRTGRSRRRKR